MTLVVLPVEPAAAAPSILVDKSVDVANPAPGQLMTFTIRFRCASLTEDCTDAEVSDAIPSSMNLVGHSGSGGLITSVGSSGATVTWDLIEPLPAGSTGTVKLYARFPACGPSSPPATVTNTATFSTSNAGSTSDSAAVSQAGSTPACETDPPPTNDLIKSPDTDETQANNGIMDWDLTFPASSSSYWVTDYLPANGVLSKVKGELNDDTTLTVEFQCANSGVWRLWTDGTAALNEAGELTGHGYPECAEAPHPTTTSYVLMNITAVRWEIPASASPSEIGDAIVLTYWDATTGNPFDGITVPLPSGGTGPALPLWEPAIVGTSATNCIVSDDTSMGDNGSSCGPFNLVDQGPAPMFDKQIFGSPSVPFPLGETKAWDYELELDPSLSPPRIQHNDHLIYGFEVRASGYFDSWVDPVMVELLDPNVHWEPGESWWAVSIDTNESTSIPPEWQVSLQPECSNPAVTVTEDWNATGRDLVEFDFAGCVLSGPSTGSSRLYVIMSVEIDAGVPSGTEIQNVPIGLVDPPANLFLCDDADPVVVEDFSFYPHETDDEDINSDGNTNELLCHGDGVDYIVPELSVFDSSKWVHGAQDPTLPVDYFSRYPNVGVTSVADNGAGVYHLYLEAQGNVDSDTIELVDVLPNLTDTMTVVDSVDRPSEWQLFLAGDLVVEYIAREDTSTGGAWDQDWSAATILSAGSDYTAGYSTATNPCRLDGSQQIRTSGASGPTGCTAPAWGPTSGGASSFSLDLDRNLRANNGTHGDMVRITLNVDAGPTSSGLPPAGSRNGKIAWNSFAYTATNTSGGEELSTEPIMVGLKLVEDPASIGNFVWLDSDHDGQQQAHELGIDGVTVRLYANDGTTLLDTALTGDDPSTPGVVETGWYRFTGLDPAESYFVKLDNLSDHSGSGPLAGMDLTLIDNGADVADSDASLDANGDPSIGATAPGANEHDPTYDFGFWEPSSVGDYVWYDTDAFGDQGEGLPVEGAAVTLWSPGPDGEIGGGDDVQIMAGADGVLGTSDDGNAPVVTGATGEYLFDDLPAGSYYVRFDTTPITGTDPLTAAAVVPADWIPTIVDATGNDNTDSDADYTGTTAVFYLPSATHDPSHDLGLRPAPIIANPVSVGDFVFEDLNGDGEQTAGELGVPGVRVDLIDGTGFVVASALTDTNGLYQFDNIEAGSTIEIVFKAPAGTTLTLANNSGVADDSDSDPDPTSGSTGPFVLDPEADLGAGTLHDPRWDAGLITTLSLGNQVWLDVDADGLFDVGEPVLAGLTVVLLDAAGNPVDGDGDGTPDSTITDANGRYIFDGLAAGDYIVEVEIPTGTESTGGAESLDPDDGLDNDDNGVDSTSNPGFVRSGVVTLEHGGATPLGEADNGTPIDGVVDMTIDRNADMTVDFGFVPVVDMALLKVLNAAASGPFAPGASVTFDLTVSNQGIWDGYDIDIDDYLPADLTYDSANVAAVTTTAGSAAVAITADGSGGFTIDRLIAGDSVTFEVTLTVASAPSDFTADNFAEVSSVSAVTGGSPVPDIDSIADNQNQNTVGEDADLIDNETGQNGLTGGDEDDHDIETIEIAVIDLEVAKSVDGDDADSTFGQNESIAIGTPFTWRISVANVSTTTDATGVVLSDTMPAGVTVSSASVTGDTSSPGGTYTTASNIWAIGTIAAGETVSVEVTAVVTVANEAAFRAGTGQNVAEITAANETDIDSSPGNAADPFDPATSEDDEDDANISAPNQLVHVGNLVFLDIDNDGVFEPGDGESGVESVTVQAWLDDGDGLFNPTTGDVLSGSDVTDSDGEYYIEDLAPGSYLLVVPTTEFDDSGDPLFGYRSSTGAASPNDDTVSDNGTEGDNRDDGADPSSAGGAVISNGVVVLSVGNEPTGETATNNPGTIDADSNWLIDFGFYEPVSIGDLVWFDTDGDGLQTAGEPGVSNVSVSLFDGTGTQITTDLDGNALPTATDASGNYLFSNLSPGDYYVQFTLPSQPGVTFTTKGPDGASPAASSDPSDSDADTTTGQTETTSLISGESDLGWDAGIVLDAAIDIEKQVADPDDGTVWYNADNAAENDPNDLFDDVAQDDAPVAHLDGDTATYRFVVTNMGTSHLANMSLVDQTSLPGCDLSTALNGVVLNPAGTSGDSIVVTTTCTSATLSADFVNVAQVTGTPSNAAGTSIESALSLPIDTIGTVDDTDEAAVIIIDPAINIEKLPDIQTIDRDAASVSFTFDVTNTSVGVPELESVAVTSDVFSPVGVGCTTLTLTAATDADGDGLLDIGETWEYTCVIDMTTVDLTGIDELTNTASVQGAIPETDENGLPYPSDAPVTDSDDADVQVAELAVTKWVRESDSDGTTSPAGGSPGPWSSSETVRAGDTVQWLVHLENTAGAPLGDVVMTDLVCANALGTLAAYTGTLPGGGTVTGGVIDDDLNEPGGAGHDPFTLLSADESWWFICTAASTIVDDVTTTNTVDVEVQPYAEDPSNPGTFITDGEPQTGTASATAIGVEPHVGVLIEILDPTTGTWVDADDVTGTEGSNAGNLPAFASGADVEYRVTVFNNTAGAVGVDHDDLTLTDVDVEVNVPDGAGGTTTVNLTVASLAPGASTVFTKAIESGLEVTGVTATGTATATVTAVDGSQVALGEAFGPVDLSDGDEDGNDTDTAGYLLVGINIVKLAADTDPANGWAPTGAFVDAEDASGAAGAPDHLEDSDVAYRFEVTNTTGVLLTSVVVSDPLAGCTPSYVSGDTDSDGALESGETWIFSCTVTGGYSVATDGTSVRNVATVSGDPTADDGSGDPATDVGGDPIVIGQPVTATDEANVDVIEFAGIGDFVWTDTDGSGDQDTNEPGLPNITVRLHNSVGAVVATVQTADGVADDLDGDGAVDPVGFYYFGDLVPGDYRIEVSIPSTIGFTLPDATGVSDAEDSDVDPTTGLTPYTTLDPGEYDMTWDAGVFPLGAIGDQVWLDINADGRQEVGEPGIADVTVNLYDSTGGLVASVQTADGVADDLDDDGAVDPIGFYYFGDLGPETYVVDIIAPANHLVTAQDVGLGDVADSDIESDVTDPDYGETAPTVLPAGTTNFTLDAGLFVAASIGDRVWFDSNGDGLQTAGEPDLEDIPVAIFNADGSPVTVAADGSAYTSTTTTNGTGIYSFQNLRPGDYYIEVTLPSGVFFTTRGPDVAADQPSDTADSDVDSTTGLTATTTLVSGEADPGWDAGITISASIDVEKQVVDPDDGTTWYNADDAGVENDGDDLFDDNDQDDASLAIEAGTTATYRFIVTNTGDTYLGSLALTDLATLPGCDLSTAFDTVPQLAPAGQIGDSHTVTVTCSSAAIIADFSNTASVAATPEDVNGDSLTDLLGLTEAELPNVSDVDQADVHPIEAAINIVKTPAIQTVDADATTATFTFTVTNTSTNIDELVNIDLDDSTTFGGSCDGALTGPTGDDGDGRLDTGETWTYSCTVNQPSAGWPDTFENTASVSAEVPDVDPDGLPLPELPDPSDEDTVEVQVADMTVEKFVREVASDGSTDPASGNVGEWQNAETVRAGDDVEWLVVIENVAGAPLGDVSLTDPVCPGTLVPFTGTAPGGVAVVGGVAGDNSAEPGGAGHDAFTLLSAGETWWYVCDTASTIADDVTTTNAVDVEVQPYAENPSVPGDFVADGPLHQGSASASAVGVEPHVSVLIEVWDPFTGIWFDADGGTGTEGSNSATPATYSIGDDVTYRVTVYNADSTTGPHDGLTLHNVTIDVVLPDGNTATLTVDDLSPGASAVFDPTVDAAITDLVVESIQAVSVATAEVSAAGSTSAGGEEFGPVDGSDGDEDVNDIDTANVQLAGLDVVKYVEDTDGDLVPVGTFIDAQDDEDPATYFELDAVVYEVRGTNTGTVPLEITSVDDPLPGCNLTGPVSDNGNGWLDVGEIWTWTCTVADGFEDLSDVRNLATVEGDPLDPTNPRLGEPIGLPLSDEDEANVDVILLASLGDLVWHDIDADGLQDPDEPGIEGVLVELIDATGAVVGSTTSLPDGYYEFTELPPGDYSVRFTPLTNYAVSPANTGGPEVDSDAGPDGVTPETTLDENEDDPTWDLGLYQTASLGDTIWLDNDRNGMQDSGEPGVEGVTVHLLDSNGTVVETAITEASGLYEFTGLVPGEYSISVEPPAGYQLTTTECGCGEDQDNDVDPETRTSDPIVIESGEQYVDLDGGLYQRATLGNVVWLDTNDNGVQDPDEPGLPGVVVTVFDTEGNVVASTQTDADGKYGFEVDPGEYVVVFDIPDRHVIVEPNSGGDDSVDSDIAIASGASEVVVLLPGENNPKIDAGVVERVIDLEIIKQGASSKASDSTATWTLSVSNRGKHHALGPIIVTDNLASSLTYVSGTGEGWTCGVIGQTVTCTHPDDLTAGASLADITIVTKVASGTTSVTNEASVASAHPISTESNSDNNISAVTLTVLSSTTSSSPLAFTGANTVNLFIVALLLLGLGAVVVARSKRAIV